MVTWARQLIWFFVANFLVSISSKSENIGIRG
ncbi:hypothetical protein CCACVL1_28755 [Corchorus capsularis]|uniref:Uncharacterized protein n=1 Tax=Corchorus capsularis TaxID=210143 RepID=A0A1R3G5C3_COCAP|nr:hypothetical protein CCACVL1_28755 [Corchorus capsularis]